MLLLLSQSLAFDQCPDPPRPHITDLAVKCEQEELSVQALVEDDESQVDQAELQIWSPSGQLVGTRSLVLDGFGPGGTRFVSDVPEPFTCKERWLLRVVATNIAGQTGERDRWLNSPVAVQNGNFEEDLWGWGVGGNAEVAWVQYETQPTDPYQGSAMLELGWPDDAYYVYGYAWQNLGELPAGDYQVDFLVALVTDPMNRPDDVNCRTEPSFYWGFNGYEDDGMDPYVGFDTTLNDYCGALEYSDDNWWLVSDWMVISETVTVPESRSDENTFLWFNHYGGYSQWASCVLIDEVYVTPPATSTDTLAASVLNEDLYVGDYLTYPTPDPDYPTWKYWDHFEKGVDTIYVKELCGDGCTLLDGKYGPEKKSPEDDVDGAWGFDGTVLHKGDDSVLLIETKSTRGSCFPFSEEGLSDAVTYLEGRRNASEKPLKKCGYEDCAQMSALWIEGTIKDLCAEEDEGRRKAAARIEEAWDAGLLYTTWAAVGFKEPGTSGECLTSWMLEAEPAPPKTRDEELCPDELE